MRAVRRARAIAAALAITMASLCSTVLLAHEAASRSEVRWGAQDEFRVAMRGLWEDHVAYTRDVIVSTLADLPDRQAVTARLLHNQDQIGDAIKPFYGAAARDKLAALLREHIVGAAEVIGAAKAGDAAAIASAEKKWKANAAELAAFLAAANPRWNTPAVGGMLTMHLRFIDDQVSARVAHDWDADIRAYDSGLEHMMKFADALTDGVVQQF
ncbi:MAG TPA: hypothetical protein VI258_00185, partial [Rhodanobacteraceae bacterium]